MTPVRCLISFQFTPLREGRPRKGVHVVGVQRISIHAPPRGATVRPRPRQSQAGISIHAPPRGATGHQASSDELPRFQFTPLREGRRYFEPPRRRQKNFNSRPSARGDEEICKAGNRATDISIHAPPRGATYWVLNNFGGNFISIHAPPRGATQLQPVQG